MNKVIRTALVLSGVFGVGQSLHAIEPLRHENEAPVQPVRKSAPDKAAPNVVWIMIDDVGFGASSAFGGLIETPNLEALAAQGLRYTNFHTTAISSPTRAALLTGRNSHSVGMGLFPETAVDLPDYNARIPASKGTIAEVLHANGYNTYAVGKWHLTPVNEATPAGPFNRWPTGKGFERYYGFLFGETDQWHPQLIEDTHRIDVNTEGKHLNTLLADKAISYIANAKSIDRDKPFFLYLTPGATHAPHQDDQSWIDKYKGKFDGGWDEYREQVLENQKKLGIISQSVQLPARHPDIKAWDGLSADEKRLFARYFEAYAGFLSQTDAEIGRVIDYLKAIGQYDNTIFAVVIGDNGASKEGTPLGTVDGLAALFTPDKEGKGIERELKNIDKIGTEFTSPNYPLGWAQAANAPFKYWKQDANAEGGTRNPLILTYPDGIKDKGGIRNQYSHIIDLLPTTLELAQVEQPRAINGIEQDPFEGISLVYSVADAKASSKRTVQYYEINGTRAIYKDGWKAATLHKFGTPFEKDVWELYDLDNDPTELHDLAAENSTKLEELKALFDSEGEKYHVFPLEDTLFKNFLGGRGAFAGQDKVVLYPGLEQIFSLSAPELNAKPYALTAEVEIPPGGAEGALVANGGRFGGSSIYLQDGKLHYAQNDSLHVVHIASTKTVGTGKARLRVEFRPESAESASIRLFVNDEAAGEGKVPLRRGVAYFSYDEGFDIGRDLQTPVTEAYDAPFVFAGKLEKVTIDYAKGSLN
ncbi:MAG TPA: arylsulfatase [Gammaproteobacteria bacterium]|nr:arylsulfatase [Gammaproteobacteria bacterium]